MGFISAFRTDPTSDFSEGEISVEYKLILRNGPNGGKLDGCTKKWKKATLKRRASNTYILTILPPDCHNIVEGTSMEWKIRKEHRREHSKQWYSRWFPKAPRPWRVVQEWYYHKPPLDKLRGEFQLLEDVFITIR